jgi:hypothetical protein
LLLGLSLSHPTFSNPTLEIRDIVASDGNELPSLLPLIEEEVNVITLPRRLVEVDLVVLPLGHGELSLMMR